MNSKCSICGADAVPDKDKCRDHAAKWQRRFFYPCRYCGGHVKSYKARRCGRPECIAQAGRDAAKMRFGETRKAKEQRRYIHRGFIGTATAWARKLRISASLMSYHLSRGHSMADIVTRFTDRKGKNNAR